MLGHYEQASRASQSLTADEVLSMQQQMSACLVRMAELMIAGKPADDPAVQAEIDNHYRWVSRFWIPDAEAYVGLGRMYTEDERFRDYFEHVADGLAAYQRDAMAAYARDRLT